MVLFLYIPPLYSTQTHIETETRFREQRIYIRYTYVYICTTGHICAAVRPIATRAQSVQANKHGELATRPRFTVRRSRCLKSRRIYACTCLPASTVTRSTVCRSVVDQTRILVLVTAN